MKINGESGDVAGETIASWRERIPELLRIIQNFKVHYRNLLLHFVLSKIDQTNDTASQIVKSVSVLTAIRWVAEA